MPFAFRSVLSAASAVALTATMTWSVAVAPPLGAQPPTPTPPPAAPQVLEVLSGAVDQPLPEAVDARTGEALAVRVVEPRFPSVYAAVPGARWVSDRFGPLVAGDVHVQARAWENSSGATIVPRPPVSCQPGVECRDYGEDWYSVRTLRARFDLPADAVPTGLTLEFAVDNTATVVLNADDPANRRALVAERPCADYATCTAEGPTGTANFSAVRTVTGPGTGLRPGPNTVDFTVHDWGSVTGLAYRLQVAWDGSAATARPVRAGAPCTPTAESSCSLTVTPLASRPGWGRWCYVPPDGVGRTIWLRRAAADGGGLQPYQLVPGSTVDTPWPADGIVGYPTVDDLHPVETFADPALTRCPGALAGG